MTKIPAIQQDIIAHLRAAGRAESSRSLASRFLRIEHGDEETCRRLLAPFLATVPGIAHRSEEGWSLAQNAPRRPWRECEEEPVPPGAPSTRREPGRGAGRCRPGARGPRGPAPDDRRPAGR